MQGRCHNYVTALDGKQRENCPFKSAQIRLHNELNISSGCDVVCQNQCNTASNKKFDRIPAANARQKTATAVVKRDKMSGLDRKDRQT